MEIQNDIEISGEWLSTIVPCFQIKLPYNKPVFECACGVPFAKFVVARRNEAEIREIHKEYAGF